MWKWGLVSFVVLGAVLGSMAAFLAMRMSKKIVRPVQKIEEALEKINRGESPGPISIVEGDELSGLLTSFNQVFEDQLKQLTEDIDRRLVAAGIDQQGPTEQDESTPEAS